MPYGWQTDGVLRYSDSCLSEGRSPNELAKLVHDMARKLTTDGGDDCTAGDGIVPSRPDRQHSDRPAGRLHSRRGNGPAVHAVGRTQGGFAGGTTAEVVARVLGPVRGRREGPAEPGRAAAL